ncbi:hypothetical protein FJ527_28675 [Mesorhizobium sp. B2-4-18]|nr:hypothetical protein FJ527_28675 [Mesorhizobium sp. B2-4-18]
MGRQPGKGFTPAHPPLPCRASPPQGGRLAVPTPRLSSNGDDWRKPKRDPISPLAEEMAGRPEGGA